MKKYETPEVELLAFTATDIMASDEYETPADPLSIQNLGTV